jgi:hypothetical protein
MYTIKLYTNIIIILRNYKLYPRQNREGLDEEV